MCRGYALHSVLNVSEKVANSERSFLHLFIQEQFNPACTLCLFVIKKLETLLPQNMTEVCFSLLFLLSSFVASIVCHHFFFFFPQDALRKLMGEVCDLLPQSYKDECDDFVDKYGVQIVEFLLSSAAPHTICALLHICLFRDSHAPGE